MVEDAVWVPKEASCDLAIAAYAFRFGQPTIRKVRCLLASFHDLIDNAIPDGLRSLSEIITDFPEMTLRCGDEDVFGHLAVASPVLEECLRHFLGDKFAALRFSHTPL